MATRPAVRLAHNDARDRQRDRQVVTPEGIPLNFRVATAGARLTALVIDIALILLTFIALTVLLLFIGLREERLGELMFVIWMIGVFVVRVFYFILFEMRPRGATPGKRRSKIRVAARDGGRLTPEAVIARNLFREIELFLPLAFLSIMGAEGQFTAALGIAGFLWTGVMLFFPLFNRDRLRAGDLLAGTWVIEQPEQDLGDRLTGQVTSEQATDSFTAEDLAHYGEHELHVLEDVLRRDDDNALEATVTAIAGKLGREVPPADRRAFALTYYEELRAHLEGGRQFGKRREDKFAEKV